MENKIISCRILLSLKSHICVRHDKRIISQLLIDYECFTCHLLQNYETIDNYIMNSNFLIALNGIKKMYEIVV